MKKTSFNIKASDGIELFIQSFTTENSENSVLLIHGLGEHSGRYNCLIDNLNNQKISVFTMDLRGHGKSQGKRGHSPSFYQLLEDIQLFIQVIKPLTGNQKRILYGHSMGGSLVINYLIRFSVKNIDGAILSSPAFKPAFTPPKIKVLMGSLFQHLIPSLTLNNELDLKGLSRDINVIDNYKNDKFVHDRLSIRLGLDLLKFGGIALKNAKEYNFPTLIVHGKKDILTSFQASKEFSENSGKKVTFIEFENAYHEIHNESEKEELLNKIISWIHLSL